LIFTSTEKLSSFTNLNGADEKEKGKILIQKIGSGFYKLTSLYTIGISSLTPFINKYEIIKVEISRH